MGIQPKGYVVRVAGDISQWSANQAITLPNAVDLVLQLYFSQGAASDATAIDYTNIATVYVALQSNANPHNATIYWQESVANAAINNACTFANWVGGTDQQLVIAVPNANNSLLAKAAQNNYWLVVYAVTNDATPKQIVFMATQVSIIDAGLPTVQPTLPQWFKVGAMLKFVCSDGQTRNVSIQELPNGRWTVDVSQAGYNGPGQATYSFYCSDGLWRDIGVVNQGGAWTLSVGQNGHN